MNEIIKVNQDNPERLTVSGRDLHEALEVETPYTMWIQRMIEYGFTEGEDFLTILLESTGGRPSTDHQLTIAMAKEIAMLQRTDKGKQVRQYFIQIEEAWNKPELVMARGLAAANALIENQKKQIAEMQPKALFADAVSASHTSILVGELAKILKGNGIEFGRDRLFEWLRTNGYLIKGGSDRNMPTQRSMELGLMEIKESTSVNPDGSIRINKTTKVTGKGQQYFVNLFLKDRK